MLTGRSEDDIMLEIIIFIGTCVSDDKCAPIFASSQLVQVRQYEDTYSRRQHTAAYVSICYIRVLKLLYIQVLYELMADKQEDDEMVLQTYAHACSRMLTYAHVCSRMLT
jgi:hypothetical protein